MIIKSIITAHNIIINEKHDLTYVIADPKHDETRCREDHFSKSSKKKHGQKNGSKQDDGVDQSQCKTRIFLPKEWTY